LSPVVLVVVVIMVAVGAVLVDSVLVLDLVLQQAQPTP
jgi:hypothetical protein